jgi:Tfp pilus assembly protein PilO
MMSIKTKTLDVICLSLLIIALVGCGYWVVNSTLKSYSQLRQQNKILSKELVELKSAEENYNTLNALLEQTREELQLVDQRIPESVNMGEVLQEIDFLMKQRKIILSSLQPLPLVEEKLYVKIPLRLIFEGSFVNIYHFTYDLETMNRMMVTENMAINRDNLQENCRAELTAAVYQRRRE